MLARINQINKSFIFQYQNIMFHLNRIKTELNDPLLVQIECTSLQWMHQPIVFHAKGYFELNYETLMKVYDFSILIIHRV